MAPGWIKTLGDNVVFDVGVLQMVKKPPGHFPVCPLVKVDGNARRGVAGGGFHPANAGFQDACQVLPLRGVVVGFRRIVFGRAGNLHLRHRPERAPGDLVADLHPVGPDPGIPELLDRVVRVGFDLFLQAGDIEVGPRGRYHLMLRIGPAVGKVQAEEQTAPGVLDAPGERDHVLQRIIRRVVPHGRDEHPQTIGGPPMPHEDGPLLVRLAVLLIDARTLGGAGSDYRDVSAEVKLARG